VRLKHPSHPSTNELSLFVFAIQGVTGAGKTSLLNVLADRISTGTYEGKIFVDGRPRDASFQRKVGYVQQEDLHLGTATVREALEFSALLRQPESIPKHEKIAYVDNVLEMLDMQSYADAVIGVPGEGLNIGQRKRLTIAVEMVAKPELLLLLGTQLLYTVVTQADGELLTSY
jgi:ATP-binding cassette, subfamily G (WHITE), member 2, PDR